MPKKRVVCKSSLVNYWESSVLGEAQTLKTEATFCRRLLIIGMLPDVVPGTKDQL